MYSSVQVDGKPMKIEIVGVNGAPVLSNIPRGNTNGASGGGLGRGDTFGRIHGGGGVARRGCGRVCGGCGEKVSAEDLDADLEKYRKESMQIN